MTEYKAGMISPFNYFTLIFVSKILVAFTACTLVLKGDYAPDILTSIAIAFAVNLALSVVIVYCYKNGKSPLNIKWLSAFYGLYFIFMGAFMVNRFSFFASTEINPESKIIFYSILLISFCVYSAGLGIEPIARFGLLVFAISVLGMVAVIAFGVREFEIINLFPFTKNGTREILLNMLFFAGDASELIILFSVTPTVNGNKFKPYFTAYVISYFMCALILFVVLGILGDTAIISSFPMFEVSQVSKFSDNERLDSIYTSFWLFAIFLKCALLIYSAAISFKKVSQRISHSGLCVISGVIMVLLCLTFVIIDVFSRVYEPIVIALYIIFCAVVPIGSLIFQRKSKGDILIEKF